LYITLFKTTFAKQTEYSGIMNPKPLFMKKTICLLLAITTVFTGGLLAQQTTTKMYSGTRGGEVELLYNWGEMRNGVSEKVFVVYAAASGYHYLKALANRRNGEKMAVYLNGGLMGYLYPEQEGWQWLGKTLQYIKLQQGKNELRFSGSDLAVPMVEEISLTLGNPWARMGNNVGDQFIQKMEALKQQPPGQFKTASDVGDMTDKVLPNPQGIYDHAIDTQFTYTHFSYIYLNAGNHTFTTSGSTINRALTVFHLSNFTYSWSNVNGGPGGESGLYLYVGLSGYYAVMLRPVTDGQTGTTNIIYNGATLVSNVAIGGRRIGMSTLKGGPMNFFTCKLTGSGADTRIIASRFAMSSARGYNDDYSTGGSWNWGLSSRIKKDFSGVDSVQYGFVCAYSPTSTGICDIYLGTGNSNLPALEPQNFPLLNADDAILTAPLSGSYNCISWSGGVTSAWIWPPNTLSTYNCTNASYLQCFDNFYSNNPVRYPGAGNYTRTGANAGNSIVDLWKTATAYTHASVRKPGNNHPHGYDWESKPGSICRTLHPRNALNQANWYGFVTDYYRPTGTYARMAGTDRNFATDADAVAAGVAIFDVAVLTGAAQGKLSKLMQKLNPAVVRQFNEWYTAWDKTKAANASLSDPSQYCKNSEHEALAAFAQKNNFACLVLVMDKFANSGDHLMGDLLVSLAKEKYGRLLEEVKTERLNKPTDEAGKYKIHGDHDNGVLYIEKILGELDGKTEIKPVAEMVIVTVSPNPVKDWFTIKLNVANIGVISVKATSAQTRAVKILHPEKELTPGNYQFTMNATGFAGSKGDIITVQVMVGGVVKTVKVMVL
jgi:hypothetical protein